MKSFVFFTFLSVHPSMMKVCFYFLSLGTMKFENFACFVVGFPILQCFMQGIFPACILRPE